MKGRTGNPELVKTVNTSVILDIIRKNKHISRAEVAKISKLNPSTVSNITRELIKTDILKEMGIGTSILGRRPIKLSLNPDGPCVIGVEVAGDKITTLMTDLEAKIIARAKIDIDKRENGKVIMKETIKRIGEVIEKSEKDKSKIRGIGMGVTGSIDAVTGIALFSPNIGWRGVPIKKLIEEEFGIQTFVDNDVKAMALGEYRFGSAKGNRDLVCMNIGEGLGSGVIIDGKIYRGANWVAGEIGHIILDLNGPRCRCGNRGCLEAFVSGQAMRMPSWP